MFTLFLSFLLLTVDASASSLLSRKTTDPYIICKGSPPTNRNGLPLGFEKETYYNTMQLCSVANGAKYNVGCYCSFDRGQVHCDEQVADPRLWAATVLNSASSHLQAFPAFCQDACSCTNTARAAAERALNRNYYAPTTYNQAATSMFGLHDDDLDDFNVSYPAPASLSNMSAQPNSVQNQCGTECQTDQDCKVEGADSGCMCATESEQYQPGSGTVAFLAACIVSLSGKRDEARPCPCNETYVSHKCCGAEDGQVWEEEEFKLGELIKRNTNERLLNL